MRDEEAKSLAERIQYGDEDEAKSAVKQLANRGPSRGEMEQAVDNVINSRKIRRKFEKDFKGLNSEPHVREMVANRVDQKLSNGKPNTYETYREAGEEIQDEMTELFGDTTDETPVEDSSEESEASSIIRDMAKARKQDY